MLFANVDDEELDEEDLELLEENTGVKVARSSGVSGNTLNGRSLVTEQLYFSLNSND